MKYDTIEQWVVDFEKWSGLRIILNKRGTSNYDVVVLSPTNVVVGKLGVSFFGEEEGWKFGGSSTLFPDDWSTLIRADWEKQS